MTDSLTTFREHEARTRLCFTSHDSVTDLEAVYAYKHGDCRRCFSFNSQNVCTHFSCRPLFWHFLNLFSCCMMALPHSLHWHSLLTSPRFKSRSCSSPES